MIRILAALCLSAVMIVNAAYAADDDIPGRYVPAGVPENCMSNDAFIEERTGDGEKVDVLVGEDAARAVKLWNIVPSPAGVRSVMEADAVMVAHQKDGSIYLAYSMGGIACTSWTIKRSFAPTVMEMLVGNPS